MINREVPFYHQPTNTHCFGACFKMIMKYFWPEKDFSWQEIDKITGKIEGKAAWPLRGLVWLHEKGFEIVHIELFDYKKFIKIGWNYFFEILEKQKAEMQIKMGGNEKQSIEDTKEFLKIAKIENRIPTIEDLKNLLVRGYLIITNRPFYHSIVVKGFDSTNLFINNPDRPGIHSIKFDSFEKLWSARSIFAIKPKDRIDSV